MLLRLRQGKQALREARRRASLEEKLLELLQAQWLYVAVVQTRRKLEPLDQPWDILRDVRDSVVIGEESIEPRSDGPVTASSARWQPLQRWTLPPA